MTLNERLFLVALREYNEEQRERSQARDLVSELLLSKATRDEFVDSLDEVASLVTQSSFASNHWEYSDISGHLREACDFISAGRRLLTLLGPSGAGKSALAKACTLEFPNRTAVSIDLADAANRVDFLRCVGLTLSDDPWAWTDDAIHTFTDRPTILVLDNFVPFDTYVQTINDLVEANPSLVVLVCSVHQLALDSAATISVAPLSSNDTNAIQSLFHLVARRFERTIAPEQFAALAPFIRTFAKQPLSAVLLAFLATNGFALPSEPLSIDRTEQLSVQAGQDQLMSLALRNLAPTEIAVLSALTLFGAPPTVELLEQVSGIELEASITNLDRLGIINLTESKDGKVASLRRDTPIDVPIPSLELQQRFVEEITTLSESIKLLADHGEWREAIRLLVRHSKDLGNAVEMSTRLQRAAAASEIFMNVGRLAFEADLKADYQRISVAIDSLGLETLLSELQIEKLGLDGAIEMMNDNYDQCRALWQTRLDCATAAADLVSVADALSDLDALEFETENFEEAIKITQRTERAAIEADSPDLLASAIAIRAHSYHSLGNIDACTTELQRVLGLLPLCHSDRFAPFVYQNCVVILDKLGRPAESEAMLTELLQRSQRYQRVVLEGWSLVRLSDRMAARNDLSQARTLLEQAVQLYRTTSAKHYLRTKAKLDRLG